MNRISDAEAAGALAREAAAVRSRHSGISVAARAGGGVWHGGVFRGHDGWPPARPPIGQTLDFELVQVEPGMAVFRASPALVHYNPMGTVHSGWFATLLDSAGGLRGAQHAPAARPHHAGAEDQRIVRALSERAAAGAAAEGRVVHGGSQVAHRRGPARRVDGKLYAHASTTCLVFDARR